MTYSQRSTVHGFSTKEFKLTQTDIMTLSQDNVFFGIIYVFFYAVCLNIPNAHNMILCLEKVLPEIIQR